MLGITKEKLAMSKFNSFIHKPRVSLADLFCFWPLMIFLAAILIDLTLSLARW